MLVVPAAREQESAEDGPQVLRRERLPDGLLVAVAWSRSRGSRVIFHAVHPLALIKPRAALRLVLRKGTR